MEVVNYYILFIFCVFISPINSSKPGESLLSPPWKHCVHPLHALPGSWGDLQSPGFPNGMSTQLQCTWIIDSNPGWRIKVAFHTLNMTGDIKNCFTQFVNIIDIKTEKSIGKFCGVRKPGDYVSFGTKLRIDIQGDTTGQPTKGFKLKFRASKEPPGFKNSFSFPDVKPKKGTFKPSSKPKKPSPNAPFSNAGKINLRKINGIRSGAITLRPPIRRTVAPKNATDAPSEARNEQDSNEQANNKPPARVQPGNPQPPRTRPQPRVPPSPSNKLFRPSPTRYAPRPNKVYGSDMRPAEKPVVVVTYEDDEDENEINLYLVIGLSVGGVLFILILAIVVKKCLFTKQKKDDKKLDENKNNQPSMTMGEEKISYPSDFKIPPTTFMMEEIIPKTISGRSPRHGIPMSMMDPNIRQRDIVMPPLTSATLPRSESRRQPRRTKSSRSQREAEFSRSKSLRSERKFKRSQSSRSLRQNVESGRVASTRSRVSGRSRTVSKVATLERKRSKHNFANNPNQNEALPGSYFDFQTGQWMWVPAPQIRPMSSRQSVPANLSQYRRSGKYNNGYDNDSSSYYSDSSSSGDSTSTDSYLEYVSQKSKRRKERHSSLQRSSYNYTKRRSGDDGYSTEKRRRKNKHKSNGKRDKSKKSKKKPKNKK